MKVQRTREIETNKFEIGDKIAFTLTDDDEEVEAMAVKQEQEQEQDGMVFVLVDCLRDEYSMNKDDTNRGSYEASDLREKLNNEILERFPDEIRKNLIAFENGDLLRLPTEREIFGDNLYGKNELKSVTQWEPMKDRCNRIAFQGRKTGTWEWYLVPLLVSPVSTVAVVRTTSTLLTLMVCVPLSSSRWRAENTGDQKENN